MKRAPLLILIIAVTLLTSCSAGGKKGNTSPTRAIPESSPVIVFISPATVIRTGPAAVDTQEAVDTQTPAVDTGAGTADAAFSGRNTNVPAGSEAPLTNVPTPGLTLSPSFIPETAGSPKPGTPGPTERPTAGTTAAQTGRPAEHTAEEPVVKPNQTPSPVPSPAPDDSFGYIERVISPVDFNANGIDDYTDILIGARKDAAIHPRYDGSYQNNGYPPDDVGVCADVIWRALREAGYSLRYMVDKDIKENSWRYPQIANGKEKRDNKIDFRRVRNLRIFFDEYAVILTRDIYEIEEWQPGDIVIFNNNSHIGIVSDIRNERGVPYIIHNGGQADREQDYLEGDHKIAAHYRFDASRIPEDMLIPWEG